MLFLIGLITLNSLSAVPQQRSQLARTHPCFADANCIGKTNKTLYYAYAQSDEYFFSCSIVELGGGSKLTINSGCQMCPNRDTYWSFECQDCLSRKDVNQKNCSETRVANPGAGNPTKPRDCPPANSCSGKNNGTYRLSNSEKNVFYSCVGGQETQCQDCPAGLIYVEVCGSCEVNDTKNVNDCPAKPTGGAPLEYCPSSFCINKDDGDYEQGDALSEFYSCTEGTCIKRRCARDTEVYTGVCKQCLTTYTKVASDCPKQAPFVPQKQKACSSEDFCAGKADGSYEASATPQGFMYTCIYGLCIRQECVSGLVFNASTQSCGYP